MSDDHRDRTLSINSPSSLQIVSALLKGTEELEQGGPLGVRQAANPFSQLVRGPRGLGGRASCALQSGGGFTVPGHQPLRIDVEGMGIESRSNRRKCSLAAFVGGIVRPAKSLGNLVGTAIASALARC